MKWTQEMEEKLATALSSRRFLHSRGVAETARDLAKRYDVDSNQAEMAGWLHDCAKQMPLQQMQDCVDAAGYIVDREVWNSPALLHGPAGAAIAQSEYHVTDPDILRAIFYHTVGRRLMSPLEKIVFLADYIEPSRDFPGVEQIRRASYQSLDAGVLAGIEGTLRHLLDTNARIYMGTIDTRNWLLERDEIIEE